MGDEAVTDPQAAPATAHTGEADLTFLLNRLNTNAHAETLATTGAAVIDPMVYLTGFSKTTPALEIVDHINLAPPTLQWSECATAADALEQFARAKGGARRLKLEDVTVSQWGLANTRIMHKLYPSGGPAITRYMAYTCKVFELFGKFDHVSVLLYDKRYREMQAACGFAWGADVPHLDTLMLNKGPATTARQQAFQTQVCKLYNRRDGCVRAGCKFLHVCHKCHAAHPIYEHRDGADHNARTSGTPADRPTPRVDGTQSAPAPATRG